MLSARNSRTELRTSGKIREEAEQIAAIIRGKAQREAEQIKAAARKELAAAQAAKQHSEQANMEATSLLKSFKEINHVRAIEVASLTGVPSTTSDRTESAKVDWKCVVCAKVNHWKSYACVVCKRSKSGGSQTTPNASMEGGTGVLSFALHPRSSHAHKKWLCALCGKDNEHCERFCQVCERPKGTRKQRQSKVVRQNPTHEAAKQIRRVSTTRQPNWTNRSQTQELQLQPELEHKAERELDAFTVAAVELMQSLPKAFFRVRHCAMRLPFDQF